MSMYERCNCCAFPEDSEGDVRDYMVEGHGWAPMKFRLCEGGVAQDRKSGFVITAVEDWDEEMGAPKETFR